MRALARHVQLVHRRRLPHPAPWHIRASATHLLALRVPIDVSGRRGFFGVFKQPPPRIKKPEFEPGWPLILTWRSRFLDNVRPPPRAELVQAFAELFIYKLQYRAPVNSTQALQCSRLFQYLLENAADEAGRDLTIVELVAARDSLLIAPKDNTKAHLDFSIALYNEIRRLRKIDSDWSGAEETEPSPELLSQTIDASEPDFAPYLLALSQYGAVDEALASLRSAWAHLEEEKRSLPEYQDLWTIVLRGLEAEGKEKEMEALISEAAAAGIPFGPVFHEIMTSFYAKSANVAEAKRWFEKPIDGNLLPSTETYANLIRLTVRAGPIDWVTAVFGALIDSNPAKAYWDLVFQWAYMALGEGVDHIKHMLEAMVQANPDTPSIRPDIDTVNGLIRAAMDKKDQYMAERFIGMANELGIPLNAVTFILQLGYRIDAKDFSGARAAYREIQKFELEGDEDLSVINKFIRALCASERPDLRTIHEITSDLEERIITLEPETVVALCMTFLQNDDQYDVIDTLAQHVFQYSSAQRKQIRRTFTQYILDPKNSTSRIWDAYQLLRQFFPEVEVENRMKLMNVFFNRKRPDMAISVFKHMKEHFNKDFRPTTDEYVRCLEGIGRCPDRASLQALHNLLKLDTTIQPNTRLYNALMIAYAACGQSHRALDFWNDITTSLEGPSYSSLEIVFYACEKKPFGDKTAVPIWKSLERMEIDIPPAVSTAYAGALAGNGNVEATKEFIGGMKASLGYEPDFMTLGVAHNALPGQDIQKDFQAWASSRFPTAWVQLERKGKRRTPECLQRFKISRDFKA